MAQTRKKRRRKHRGTQTGRVDRRGRAGRPRSREEARARARKQMGDKRDRPPTWTGAMGRAALGAVVFFAAVLIIFKQALLPSLGLAALVFVFYIPMGHALDSFLYRRRMLAKKREHEARKTGR